MVSSLKLNHLANGITFYVKEKSCQFKDCIVQCFQIQGTQIDDVIVFMFKHKQADVGLILWLSSFWPSWIVIILDFCGISTMFGIFSQSFSEFLCLLWNLGFNFLHQVGLYVYVYLITFCF